MSMNTDKDLIELLRRNARFSDGDIAAMLGISEGEVAERLDRLEKEGIIIGYSAIINEEKYDRNHVTAFIELRVSPKTESGYNVVAETISQFEEVDSVQLMSGSFDLAVTIRGTNLRGIALFVSDRLAPLDGVLSTTTHFILERYKEKGALFTGEQKDDRGMVSP